MTDVNDTTTPDLDPAIDAAPVEPAPLAARAPVSDTSPAGPRNTRRSSEAIRRVHSGPCAREGLVASISWTS